EHVVDVRRVVDDLVEREQREVDRHQLHHRPQPRHRRADAHADDRVLGDRRVAHAPLAELLEQPLGDLEGAAEDADVLAHQHHALVAAQLLAQSRAERLAVADLGGRGGHQPCARGGASPPSSPAASALVSCCGISSSPAPASSPEAGPAERSSVVSTEYHPCAESPSTYTSSNSSPLSGNGEASANSTARSTRATAAASIAASSPASSTPSCTSRSPKTGIGSRRRQDSTSSFVRYCSGSAIEWPRKR